MVKKILKNMCKKIGEFLIYCLNLAEYEKVIEKKIDSPNKVMREWLFGAEEGDDNNE